MVWIHGELHRNDGAQCHLDGDVQEKAAEQHDVHRRTHMGVPCEQRRVPDGLLERIFRGGVAREGERLAVHLRRQPTAAVQRGDLGRIGHRVEVIDREAAARLPPRRLEHRPVAPGGEALALATRRRGALCLGRQHQLLHLRPRWRRPLAVRLRRRVAVGGAAVAGLRRRRLGPELRAVAARGRGRLIRAHARARDAELGDRRLEVLDCQPSGRGLLLDSDHAAAEIVQLPRCCACVTSVAGPCRAVEVCVVGGLQHCAQILFQLLHAQAEPPLEAQHLLRDIRKQRVVPVLRRRRRRGRGPSAAVVERQRVPTSVRAQLWPGRRVQRDDDAVEVRARGEGRRAVDGDGRGVRWDDGRAGAVARLVHRGSRWSGHRVATSQPVGCR
mmetsp:Transcript_67707/g.195712  ORF Transcript_67707/g.195712 Transcript_67707/m.195712 type:complete len:386 (-) Transcript_67707:81-1238(-)